MNHKRGAPPTLGHSKLQNEQTATGDELQGDYTREQLVRMDEKFCERLERAIDRGEEHAGCSNRTRP